ncbi:MAG TPA: hypothetical protein VHQ45_14060 [Gemmatimonadaceae bacterium]|nr:hypothetical protein [Gemmatimonadaceae bacterium]
MSAAERAVEHVMCLGCGCGCDDITVRVRDDRIIAAERACPRGAAWFGDGVVPARSRVEQHDVSMAEAVAAAARTLARAARPLVYLTDDLSCEAQGECAAIADRLHAMLDTLSTSTVLSSLLAAQRRGRAAATFGEIRNRGDVIVFWGMDPAARYPRYWARVAPAPAGAQVPDGRRSRTVIAVDVGDARGPDDADVRVHFANAEEEDALAIMRATVLGRPPAAPGAGATNEGTLVADAVTVATTLLAARYAVIVHDAEPVPGRTSDAAEGLIALAQALNGPTRCALSTLRAGGNRMGADAVLTWRTGFPMAVDLARGAPRYRPLDGAARMLERGEIDAALVVGVAASVPESVSGALRTIPCVVVGPRASENALGATVIIDTGVAGIHEGGMAVRADDIPLPLRPSMEGPPATVDVLRALRSALGGRPMPLAAGSAP